MVEIGEASLTPSAQHLKRVLALLILYANESVPMDTIMRELWGESHAPVSAVTAVQTYVLGLRKMFAGALHCSPRVVAKSILVTHQRSYRLNLPPDAVDVLRFGDLARTGSRALAVGDARRSADVLSEALAIWRGPALSDVQTGPVLDAHITELHISRLAVVEQRIAADLLLGRHYEVLGELAALSAEHPFNEALHAQYLLALHHTGRRAEALKVYQRLRDTLASQLGLEPIPALQDIHRAVLGAEQPDPSERALRARLRAVGAPVPLAA